MKYLVGKVAREARPQYELHIKIQYILWISLQEQELALPQACLYQHIYN